ncbi:MANSC domain-containing protein 1 [Mugil cephalus]|uniref:MANSC domain-containing protein 1 n=1 Tax=Mugil cephalus TaxID=48193 RepID=UPI001FB613E5|nr:MANSC domain-containing protein 1 [Mugil cephalus]XP_047431733.1 MANSC domain-containing protein 1 [Mugil cephalus]XP_047431734.1 MANSC domain-containing protein 1 [Mugil cephalus]
MTPPAARPPSLKLRLLPAAVLVVMMSLPVSAVHPGTCFSRQHQNAVVDYQKVHERPTVVVLVPDETLGEKGCVSACCTHDLRPGVKCNMAVFNSSKVCVLLHCPTEQDCPLMRSEDATNTYDIYKGQCPPPWRQVQDMNSSYRNGHILAAALAACLCLGLSWFVSSC